MACPRELGFRMPAEWEPHEATWIAWPHEREDWPGKFAPIPFVYTEIVRLLALSEQVRIIVPTNESKGPVRRLLEQANVDVSQVRLHALTTDRCWLRDTGPLFLTHSDGRVAASAWRFNAWAKYTNFDCDRAVAAFIAAAAGVPTFEAMSAGKHVVLEGGSVEINGAGLLLTTEECLLSPVQARNPDLSKEALEQVLSDYLGVAKILWLEKGIEGDDTHGHIDDLARFVAPTTIVAVRESNQRERNHSILEANWERLQSLTGLNGERFELVSLPMPEPIWFDGQRLPASYANFYIANKHVLVPTFNDPSDRVALGTLAELFPTRKVVGIHCLDLVLGLGTLHCLTQQQPRGAA